MKYPYLIILLILAACATRSVPTGGPKDEQAPGLVSSTPPHETTNFKGQEIELVFDEKVIVEGMQSQLIITPRIDVEYDSRVRKERVLIVFKDPLPDSTTFTLNFREAIKDINEKNPAENLVFAFSTGPEIDTLSISGIVRDKLNNRVMEDHIVGIYFSSDTLDIFNSPPIYLTKTDNSGRFTLRNLKSESYRIYAFEDKNNNLKCDYKSEAYSFLPLPLQLDSMILGQNLQVLKLNVDSLRLISSRQSGQYHLLRFNKEFKDYNLTVESEDSIYSHPEEDDRTIRVYNTFPITDSLKVSYSLNDSAGYNLQGEFYLQFEESNRKPDPFVMRSTNVQYNTETGVFKSMIEFSKPLSTITWDSLYIRMDSVRTWPLDSTYYDSLTNHSRKLYLRGMIPVDSIAGEVDSAPADSESRLLGGRRPGRSVPFSVRNNAFISVEGDSVPQKDVQIQFVRASQFGIINGSVVTDQESFIVQLTDKDFNLIRSQKDLKTFRFQDIPPGEYRIRVLVDENRNGQWDPGNILLNLPPEPVYFYRDNVAATSIITIRANWEIDNIVVEF